METTLDKGSETFVVYVAALEIPMSMMIVYSIRIFLLATLKKNKALTEVPMEYSNFTDVFLPDQRIDILDYNRINEYAIKLVKDKPLLYSLIYTLSPIELKTLKMYIKTNLKTAFIYFFKFFA